MNLLWLKYVAHGTSTSSRLHDLVVDSFIVDSFIVVKLFLFVFVWSYICTIQYNTIQARS